MLEATRLAGLHRLQNFLESGRAGRQYERERNHDLGENSHANVSVLSPYIRHRLVLETEALARTLLHETPADAEKFIQEICWRTYWKGWLEQRPWIWQQYCVERNALEQLNPALQKAIAQAIAGRSGIECFDYWTQELVTTGYLHNHARMWFASIWIFTLRLPWQAGADFFMQHLCDADAASNTLSWRWVAGLHTAGKHYLARAENIARYTQGRFNPRGQLNETADSLTETSSQPNSKALSPLFVGAAPFSANPFSTTPVSADSVFILHDEDLSPETLAHVPAVAGLVVIDTSASRSHNALGSVSQQFVKGALSDARSRAIKHWALNPDQVIDCADPSLLAATLNDHQTLSGRTIVSSWLPVGPTRDALAKSLVKLTESKPPIRCMVRSWDALAWPHASRGYFQFKTQIPQLLRVGLDTVK